MIEAPVGDARPAPADAPQRRAESESTDRSAGQAWPPHDQPPTARRRIPFPLTVTAWALATISVLALWALAFAFVLSGWNETGAQRRLYAQAREELAAQTGPVGGKITPGAPVAVLDVPKLHIDHLVVVEGTSAAVLRGGPGHRRDTPLPGQPGSAVVMGRSLLYGAPFERVPDLRSGDKIVVTTGQGRFTYVVDGIRYGGDKVPALSGAGDARLTLVTALTRNADSDDTEAVFVDAHLKGQSQKAPKARIGGIDANELPMASDSGGLVLVFVYLELLVAVVICVAWAAAKWRLWPTVIVGVPLVVAALWLVTDAATVLLPNLS